MPFRLGTEKIKSNRVGSNTIGKAYVGLTKISGGNGFEDAFEEEYRRVLHYARSVGYNIPSVEQQIKQNQLVLDMKNAGITWSDLDLFYVFAVDAGVGGASTAFAKINWANPGTYQVDERGPAIWYNNVGFGGNGTDIALDTTYVPSTDWSGGDDVSMGAWMDLNVSDGAIMGGYLGTRTHIMINTSLSGDEYGISMASSTQPTTGTAVYDDGLYVTDNDGVGFTRMYRNGVQVDTTNDGGASTFSQASIAILARKTGPNNTDYDNFSDYKTSMAFFGKRVVGQNIYTPFNTYLSSL